MSMADVNMKINKNMGIEFQQQGFALIEVLISVVVLALGILALLATQLRSVGSVREAETQSIAAQAAQNLIEGMTANPQLELVGSDGVWTKRKYDHYIIEKDPLPDPARDSNDSYDTTNLALKQLKEFNAELNASKLGDMNVRTKICKTNSLKTAIAIDPDTGEVSDWGCDNKASNKVAIKIAWLVQPLSDKNTDKAQTVSYQTYIRDGE
ncbi:type IV pilus modification protein PilV [Neisseria elongata]|uniref:type IV pilus modification protein PilV n=1 Tax=Neisseria elongata TaxID=495 RepID=UPI0009E33D6F|nr:type IV pilus modification protein PilV [Neisseria elongata]